MDKYANIFNQDILKEIFPSNRTDDFFEALFGDAEDGSYDISLAYVSGDENSVKFELQLKQRPGCCLACNLTYGLPQVFSRHPIINIEGISQQVAKTVGRDNATWKLGSTKEKSSQLHVIPLEISFS